MNIDDECEWNPRQDREKWNNDIDHKVPAQVIVGSDGNWRLCIDCATLPRFDRLKTRKRIVGILTPTAKEATK